MARINIEESFWNDARFKIFSKKLGDEDRAIGMMVRLWRLAQEYWKKDQLIDEKIFELSGFSDLLFDVGLVIKTDKGIYVKGSKTSFNWLMKIMKGAKNGGKASVISRENRFGTPNPRSNILDLGEPSVNPSRTPCEPLVNHPLSFIPSPSSKTNTTTLVNTVDSHPLAILWNKNCGHLTKVKVLNKKRLKLANKLWDKNKDEKYWVSLITRLLSDKFMSGENDRGWQANFDYFLRDDVQIRLLEGSIGNKKSTKKLEDIFPELGE